MMEVTMFLMFFAAFLVWLQGAWNLDCVVLQVLLDSHDDG
jgi:hypothetical protein